MWKRPYKAVRCASKSRPSKKGTQRCSEYLRTGRAGTKGNEYLLSILPRQLELTHKEDHIANSKEGTGQMGNTNVIHMAVQNSRQHPSLDRHCFEKWVIFVHRLRLDPLRMILEIASSVAENPVLRLDCESWTLAHILTQSLAHTRLITSVPVMRTSATVAERNHTRADKWSSGFRLKSLIMMILIVVQSPPAELDTGISIVIREIGPLEHTQRD